MTTAVILAGGLGTRLRPVVDDRPKPMAEVAGRPFLEHLLGYWKNQGVTRFVLSIGYRGEIIKHYFGAIWQGIPLDYVQESHPLGTGGALLMCHREIGLETPFILLNGDTFFEVELEALVRRAEQTNADCIFTLFPTSNRTRYLDVRTQNNGKVVLCKKQNGIPTPILSRSWANGGVYWIDPLALSSIDQFDLPVSLELELMPHLESEGRKLFAIRSRGTFIDIGVPEDYLRAQTMPCFNK